MNKYIKASDFTRPCFSQAPRVITNCKTSYTVYIYNRHTRNNHPCAWLDTSIQFFLISHFGARVHTHTQTERSSHRDKRASIGNDSPNGREYLCRHGLWCIRRNTSCRVEAQKITYIQQLQKPPRAFFVLPYNIRYPMLSPPRRLQTGELWRRLISSPVPSFFILSRAAPASSFVPSRYVYVVALRIPLTADLARPGDIVHRFALLQSRFAIIDWYQRVCKSFLLSFVSRAPEGLFAALLHEL